MFEPGLQNKGIKGGDKCFRYSRRFLYREILRYGKQSQFVLTEPLLVAAAADKAKYPIAWTKEADGFAYSFHDAGEFQTWYVGWYARRRRIETFALQDIGAIYTECFDFYKNLPGLRFYLGSFCNLQYIRVSTSGDGDGAQDSRP